MTLSIKLSYIYVSEMRVHHFAAPKAKLFDIFRGNDPTYVQQSTGFLLHQSNHIHNIRIDIFQKSGKMFPFPFILVFHRTL